VRAGDAAVSATVARDCARVVFVVMDHISTVGEQPWTVPCFGVLRRRASRSGGWTVVFLRECATEG
jgi:hypothetical protein